MGIISIKLAINEGNPFIEGLTVICQRRVGPLNETVIRRLCDSLVGTLCDIITA